MKRSNKSQNMKGVCGKDTNNKLQPQPTENKITVLDFPI